VTSDGTSHLLGAYLPDFEGGYLIEEPGIHPRAVETMFQSLSSVYSAQILLATHSPVILGMADVESVLCFAKTPEGATDIVRGSEHPALPIHLSFSIEKAAGRSIWKGRAWNTKWSRD
jgi:hypothetical protein